MLRACALVVIIAMLIAIAVPWYWAFLPWSSDATYYGIPLDVLSSACAVAFLVLIFSSLTMWASRRRAAAIERARRETAEARKRLTEVSCQLKRQTEAQISEAAALHDEMESRELKLESQREELRAQVAIWKGKRDRGKAGLRRQEQAIKDRADRLTAEVEELEQERSSWEERWRKRENELSTNLEQLRSRRARWSAESSRDRQALADREKQASEKQARTEQLQKNIERDREVWNQKRRTDENQLVEHREAIERQARDFEIQARSTEQRLAKRAETLARKEDETTRQQEAGEERRYQQEVKLDEWEDQLTGLTRELESQRERVQRDIAHRRARLEQQETALATREKRVKDAMARWSEQKRRWENEIAVRSERLDTHHAEQAGEPNGSYPHSGDARSESEPVELFVDDPVERSAAAADIEFADIDEEMIETADFTQEIGTQEIGAIRVDSVESDDPFDFHEGDALHDSDQFEDELEIPIAHRLALLGRNRNHLNRPK